MILFNNYFKMDFLKEAKKIENEIIELRRKLHRNPEIGFELKETNKIVEDFLKKENIPYYKVAKSGIVATIKGEKQSSKEKTIAIRADMDALPLIEKKETVYKSNTEGCMHACGHDGHTAMVLGAGKVLNSLKNSFSGTVKLFFEPAEETTGGAQIMIKEGVLLNPKVDSVLGLHVDENLECGKIGIKRGTVYASSNPFIIKIFGSGAHGASPNKGIDSILIASEVVLALQSIVSREMSPTSPAVITVGKINGGRAQNAIADEVILEGMIRTVKIEDRKFITKRFREVVEGIVNCKRGKCEITIHEGYPCLLNDNNIYDFFYKSAEEIVGKDNIKIYEEPTMGVESFSYFSLEVPSMFYWLGCRNEEKDIIYPAHSSLFDIDEEALAIGVAIHSKMAVDFLNS